MNNKSKRTISRQNRYKRIKAMADNLDLDAYLANDTDDNGTGFEELQINISINNEINIGHAHNDENHEDGRYVDNQDLSISNFSILNIIFFIFINIPRCY